MVPMRKINTFIPLIALIISTLVQATESDDVYIQLGSFTKESNAYALRHKLKTETNTPVQVSHGDKFHTVRMGPFQNSADALSIKNNLKFANNDAQIIHLSKVIPLKTTLPTAPDSVFAQFPNSLSLSEMITKHAPTFKTLPSKIKLHAATSIANASHTNPITTNTVTNIPPPALPDLKINNNYKPKVKPKRLWNLRQADIRSVINEVAKETDKNFIIDPRVQGKITIISGHEISADELYQVFLSMLQVSGFSAIPSGSVVKIIPNIEARSQASDGQSMKGLGSGDEMIVQVVPVKYVPSEQLVPILRPLMPQWSNVSAYGPSNTLILSGRADNIKRLAYIINQVDSSSSSGIDVVPLNNALAMDVVSTIKSLLDNQKSRSFQRPTMIAADDQSNTVLISGAKTERLRIRILISQLDKENSNSAGNTEIVYLKYLRAQDLIPILSGVAKANFSGSVGTTIGTVTSPTLDGSTPSNSSDSSVSGSGGQEMSSSPQPIDASGIAPNTQASSNSSDGDKKPKVQIIAEPNTNSIILSAPTSVMRILRRIIAKLDTRPAQVLVEALIVEINEDDVQQLGIEWGMTSNSESGKGLFQRGFAIINSDINLNQFQAQIYALIVNKRANVLSTPSVVVLDNHQAKILVGKEVSIQDSSYPGNAGGGTTNPYNTFTRQKVALHLYVRPQISHDNNVQLQIDHGNDTLANPAEALTGRPVLNISNILTSVMVNSGDILVLGGLIQNGLSTNGIKIPIVGDIPGLGELFQNNTRKREKKVLMVFLRPVIIKDEKSALQVTGSKYFTAREEQLNWVRHEPYNRSNKEIELRDLQKITLPKPFQSPSTTGKAISWKTK